MNDKEKELLCEFFQILDRTEESDSGRIFHPTTITSVRVMEAKRLNEILLELKARIKKHHNHDPIFPQPEIILNGSW